MTLPALAASFSLTPDTHSSITLTSTRNPLSAKLWSLVLSADGELGGGSESLQCRIPARGGASLEKGRQGHFNRASKLGEAKQQVGGGEGKGRAFPVADSTDPALARRSHRRAGKSPWVGQEGVWKKVI